MRKLWCLLFGHRWHRWGSKLVKGKTLYRRILVARCYRCGRHKMEFRWAFSPSAGALTYFAGEHIPLR